MTDDELSTSLQGWVPPWQRPKAEPPHPAGDDDDDDQRPETDVTAVAGTGTAQRPEPGIAAVTGAGDGDERPETDRTAALDTSDGAAWSGGDEDDQRPETDFGAETDRGGVAWSGGDDDQRPETDFGVVAGGAGGDEQPAETGRAGVASDGAAWSGSEGDEERLGVVVTAGTGDDEEQRPETDVADVDEGERPENLPAALEAILLVVDEPVPDDVLAEVVGVPVAEVTEALGALAAEYTASARGFDLRRAAGGWRLYTRIAYSPYVERFVLDGQSVRLTQAALETLAVIAYQQPVTRSRMAAIRGVNCDGVVRTLTTRGLIEECGTQPESGAFLYRTTPLFLEKLGLDTLDQLPPLAPFLPDDVNGLADA